MVSAPSDQTEVMGVILSPLHLPKQPRVINKVQDLFSEVFLFLTFIYSFIFGRRKQRWSFSCLKTSMLAVSLCRVSK